MLRVLRSTLIRALPVVVLVLGGCTSTGVGDPCTPEAIPQDGFNPAGSGTAREVYLETNSVQCRTRVCMVYGLRGDPTKIQGETSCPNPSDPTCTTHEEVSDRVYCSCRCRSDTPNTPLCGCPSGFECRDVVDFGSPGVVGGYCVKSDVSLGGN